MENKIKKSKFSDIIEEEDMDESEKVLDDEIKE